MAEPVETQLGFEVIGVSAGTVLTTARGLASLPTNAAGELVRTIAMIQCASLVDSGGKGNVAVKWRNDGTDPTSDIGMELLPGQALKTATSLSALKFIGIAANAKLNVTYEHYPQTVI